MTWIKDKNDIFVQEKELEKISYPEVGNSTSFTLEEEGLWFKQRNELILQILKNNHFSSGFLDIGGGNGYQAMAIQNHYPNADVFFCEPGYEGCLNAKKRGINNIYNGFFQDFPFQENNIQAVGLFDVVEHIENDVHFLNDLYERISPGTKVYINVPALNTLWAEVDIVAGHYRRYNKKELKRLLSNTKFKLVKSGYLFSFYIIPIFLLRVIPFRLGMRKGAEKILASETQNHKGKDGLINKYINWSHKIALNKLKSNKFSPIGTSMFIVLEK